MDTENFDAFISKLEMARDKSIKEKFGKEIKQLRKKGLKQVKQRTPADTGRLRRSWKTGSLARGFRLYNNTEYANHVEYGHRVRGSTRSFNPKVVPGKFMLRNTIKALKKEIPNTVKIFED